MSTVLNSPTDLRTLFLFDVYGIFHIFTHGVVPPSSGMIILRQVIIHDVLMLSLIHIYTFKNETQFR